MKKILLLALVVFGGITTANAADVELYLHNNNNNWGAYPAFTNKGTNPDNSSEIVYEYVLNSTTGLGSDDFYFRLKWSDYDEDLCPYGKTDYQFVYNDGVANHTGGQWETYTINHNTEGQTWGAQGAFIIAQSTIKAKEYKITVYANRGNVYYLKVEIVSMPATIQDKFGFATFSCDRALDLSGVNAYYASGVTDGKVVLTKTTGKVPAATGLLLAGSGDITIPVVPTAEASDLSGNLLKASVTETEVAASTTGTYHYFLAGTNASDLGFYNLASTANSAAGKAYLETTTELASDTYTTRAAWIFQDETQGINDAVRTAVTDDVIYDLQGRLAKTAKAGLYIKNGKKFFVK